jgi:14-3-3 protein epsilon
MTSRDELIYMAKVTEQTERFEDMVDHMKKVVMNFSKQALSVEERNLLSVAYKNSIGSRRSAWRAINSISDREERKSSKFLPLIQQYKKKLETELNNICNDILSLIDSHLIPASQTPEEKVFYYKMKGDYYRYISEYASGDAHKEVGQKALAAYTQATEQATSSLKTTHPIRLGLALNSSVFYYEVMNDPAKACSIAKQAFDDAIADIEHIDEDQYKDATTIMQLIRDNLTLWTSDLQDEEGEGGVVENL